MIPRVRPAAFSVLLLVIPLGFAGRLSQDQEKRDDRHRSPRATVRALLTAVLIAQEHPEMIQDAAACLDLGGLPADQRDTGGLLARQLEAVLRARDVDTELIPDEGKGDVYVLADGPGARIALRRLADDRWLFEGETVARIPKLYVDSQKRLQDRNRETAALNVSPDYASARATVRTLVNGYRRQDFSRILGCFDLSDIPSVARDEVGRQLANKLK
jgi:hypothetical protein